MKILPIPKIINTETGFFRIQRDTVIAADSFFNVRTALFVKNAVYEKCRIELKILAEAKKNAIRFVKTGNNDSSQDYTLEISENGAVISAESECGLYYGATTLVMIINEYGFSLPYLKIEDSPDILKRGVLLDVTRGRVPKNETLMKMIREFSFYKINQVYLYIEHTYEYSKISEAWRGVSPLSAADILEIKEYAKQFYVELVPCFASFGHLYGILSTKSYSHLAEMDIKNQYSWIDRQVHHTVDVSNPESFELIKSMIDETLPLFDSPYFNLCCDETFDLGKGKSRMLAEEKGVNELYCEFVLKLCDYVKSKGKIPMVFADILLHDENIDASRFDGCVLVTWAYGKGGRGDDVKRIAELGAVQYTCCGTSGWNRFINDFETAKDNIISVSRQAALNGAVGVINTDWGDMGHINLPELSEMMYMYGAACSWNTCLNGTENISGLISEMAYGEGNSDMMSILEQLSECEIFNWADIYAFHEIQKKNVYNEFDKIAPWVSAEFVSERDTEKAYKKAVEIYNILCDKTAKANGKTKDKLNAGTLMSAAVALAAAYCAVIKKDIYAQTSNYAVEPFHLAEKFENWMSDYEKLWRMNYRESELHRIRELVNSVCDCLRNIKTAGKK